MEEPIFYIRDKWSGRVHGFGEDRHDDIWVDDSGTIHYVNLQCGEGCAANSISDQSAGYEICPMEYGFISIEYYEQHKKDFERSGYKVEKSVMGIRLTKA